MAHATIGHEKLQDVNAVARIVAEAEAATLERRVEGHQVEAVRPGETVLQLTCSTACPSGGGGRCWTKCRRWRRRTTPDHIRTETEDGNGAVSALDRALRQCLFALYPEIAAVHMTDYQLKPLEPAQGTMSRARVACTWSGATRQWVTAGLRKILWKPRGWLWCTASACPLVLLGNRGHVVTEPADTAWAV